MYSASLVLLSYCHVSAYTTDQQLTLDIQISLFPGASGNAEVQKLKYGNGSTERKYRSEKSSRLSVFSAILTHECVCWGLVAKMGLNLCDVKAGSSALGLRQALLSQCACSDSQTQTKTNGECMGQPCGLYAHRSLRTSPRQDCTHRVMLNDYVSARCSPIYQYLALTSLRDSHPLPTRHICEPIGGFSSHFCISISVLPFRYFGFSFSVFHLPCFQAIWNKASSTACTDKYCKIQVYTWKWQMIILLQVYTLVYMYMQLTISLLFRVKQIAMAMQFDFSGSNGCVYKHATGV